MSEDNGIDSDEEHMPEMRLSTTDNSIEENEEILTLIWFNPVVNPIDNNEKIKKDLRVINDVVLFPTDIDSCITDIELRKTEKIRLIISANNALKLPRNILDLPQLDSIFIHPENRAESDHLRNKYPKVVDVFDNASELLISTKENITQSNTPLKILSFYDQHQQGTRDLSGQPAGFLWFQLFKDVIQNLPDGNKANAKEEMLTVCRRHYENNEQKLKSIDEFDQTYYIGECIRWYTKNTFVYELINKALRTEDIEQLYIFRYYIADLSKQLAEKHAIMKNNDEKKITLYRGSLCNKKEIEKLTAIVGELFAITSYWSTSRSRSCALMFVGEYSDDLPDMVPVLFEIECDLQGENDSAIFADILGLSQFPMEEEFLFDAGSIFQIEEIRKEEKDDAMLTMVKIRTSEKGREVVETYIKEIRQEMKYESPRIMLGILLKRIGKYKKSLAYYEELLKTPGEEKISHIYNRIGIAVRNENKDGLALEYFDTAYDLTCKFHPSERIYLAFIRHNQGQIYAKQRHYGQALRYYEDAVKIIKEELNDTNRYIAEYYSSIGRVYLSQRDHKRALYYQRKSLRIRELCLPSNHLNHAFSYVEIAKIFSFQKNYEKAFKYHRRALELRQNYLLPDHVNTAYSLHQVGKMYYEKSDSETARNYYKESLEMTRKCLPASEHYTAPGILQDIALTYDYSPQKALDYRLEALQIQKNVEPVNYLSLTRLLDDIAFTYKLLDRKADALIYYEEALQIRETYFYDDKFKLARLYDIIASVYKSMGKKKDSLEFYQKALQIRETYFYDDRFELARTLDGLASVCEQMGKIRWALNSYYKIIPMCTHHYHSYHWLCKKTRRNIQRIEGMLK